MEDNQKQGVISRKRLEVLNWCRYIGKVAWPRETKV